MISDTTKRKYFRDSHLERNKHFDVLHQIRVFALAMFDRSCEGERVDAVRRDRSDLPVGRAALRSIDVSP
jgi:hypothetical protein